MDPRIIATVGLGMDIVGIGLLYWFGALWSDAPVRGVVSRDKAERDDIWGRWGQRWGLGFAVVGFGLQAWAQWL